MALQSNASRFAFLMDDAPDPFESVKKKKPSNPDGSSKSKSGKNNKKNPNEGNKSGKPATQNDQKQLLSMAFGGSKKKKGKSGSEKSGNGAGATDETARHMSPDDPQYEEWRQRDLNYVSGTFESDLEAALLQSKVDFQSEKIRTQNKDVKSKSKKKATTVSLTDFNASIANNGGTLFAQVPRPPPSDWAGDGSNGPLLPEEEIEKLRREAQLELKRELQLEMSRDLMKSRTYVIPQRKLVPEPSLSTPGPVKDDTDYTNLLAEKDTIIAQLSEEKLTLEDECHRHKDRFKKVMGLIEEAKLKDSVLLLAEVAQLKKIQQQLTDEITSLHSQLEQERSKAHTATLECKKLEQSRRRTTSTTEVN